MTTTPDPNAPLTPVEIEAYRTNNLITLIEQSDHPFLLLRRNTGMINERNQPTTAYHIARKVLTCDGTFPEKSISTITNWETGHSVPHLNLMQVDALADAYDVTLKELAAATRRSLQLNGSFAIEPGPKLEAVAA